MTDTNPPADRTAEIRAHLTESGEIDNIGTNNLAWLLAENDSLAARVEELQAQLDAAASAIRENHRPLSSGGFSSRKTFVCNGHESWLDWPCSEARRVYTEEEIQQVLRGADDEH
jgi:hypothetical protein